MQVWKHTAEKKKSCAVPRRARRASTEQEPRVPAKVPREKDEAPGSGPFRLIASASLSVRCWGRAAAVDARHLSGRPGLKMRLRRQPPPAQRRVAIRRHHKPPARRRTPRHGVAGREAVTSPRYVTPARHRTAPVAEACRGGVPRRRAELGRSGRLGYCASRRRRRTRRSARLGISSASRIVTGAQDVWRGGGFGAGAGAGGPARTPARTGPERSGRPLPRARRGTGRWERRAMPSIDSPTDGQMQH